MQKIFHSEISFEDCPDLMDAIMKEVSKNSKKGKKTIMKVEELSEKISPKQRAYYFGVVIKSCTQSEVFKGWSIEAVHQYLKCTYLKENHEYLDAVGETEVNTGNISEIVFKIATLLDDLSIAGSSDTSCGDFERFCTRIRSGVSMKHNIYIPLPNESQSWEGSNKIK